ncbi:hypothetical protein [Marinomonas mediterranea]|uniref:hypothetical protein n=1 Tax=Marinomonas mediterranea TaxID=119864 RepID=UPI00234BD8BC|nr:hypothetical protein [Marinomonas mediterranea]WCN08899.1 hypothetical protein GV055_08185 [Marinomonas mediterranea]
MVIFEVIPKHATLETLIPLKSDAPADVVNEYEINHKALLTVWKNTETDLCGCIQNNRSVNTVLSYADKVVVYEIKPAKGSGWVGMTLQSEAGKELVTLFSIVYSQSSINWLIATQEQVANFLGIKAEFQDLGYDA